MKPKTAKFIVSHNRTSSGEVLLGVTSDPDSAIQYMVDDGTCTLPAATIDPTTGFLIEADVPVESLPNRVDFVRVWTSYRGMRQFVSYLAA